MRPQLPECRNPDHPQGQSRASMACAEERADCFIFYCTTCAAAKIQSVQVRTKAAIRNATRRMLAQKNQLLKAPPPRVNKMKMDESLRDEYQFEMNKKSRRSL